MTGDQRHRKNILNGQRVSRCSLPTLCFLFFSHPHFLKTILAHPQVAHLALPQPQANPSQTQKSHFFAYAQEKCINLKSEFFKPKQLIELSN